MACQDGEMPGRRRPADVLDAESLARIQDQLMRVLPTLSEREVGVVRLRFGLVDGHPRSLDEIGQVYGVTGQRIRQILERAMSKLQAGRSRS
jgi:RNA polymerase primary sigma factor